MTTSTEAVVEMAAREAIFDLGYGLRDFKPVGPLTDGEPLTLSNGERTVTVEVRVHDVTGWEHER